jgi:hypothetical protein
MIAVDEAAGKRIAMDAIGVGPITKAAARIPIHMRRNKCWPRCRLCGVMEAMKPAPIIATRELMAAP